LETFLYGVADLERSEAFVVAVSFYYVSGHKI
jgi:hypothetical protein